MIISGVGPPGTFMIIFIQCTCEMMGAFYNVQQTTDSESFILQTRQQVQKQQFNVFGKVTSTNYNKANLSLIIF